MTLLLVSTDLMAASQLEGAARQVEARLRTTGPAGIAAAFQSASTDGEPSAAMVVTLDLASVADIAATVAEVRRHAPTGTPIVAYGPHVHAGRLHEARDAGCELVLTRGQFLQGAANVFGELLKRA